HALELTESFHRLGLLEERVVDPGRIERRAVLVWIALEVGEELSNLGLRRHKQPHLLGAEFCRLTALMHAPLVGIHSQIRDGSPVRHLARSESDIAFDLREAELPVLDAQRIAVAALIEIEEVLARTLFRLAAEVGAEIIAVEMDLERLVAGLEALLHFT